MSAASGVNEVEAALAAAAAETKPAPAEAGATDGKVPSDDGVPSGRGKTNFIPQDRFNEVNEARKLAIARIEALERDLAGTKNASQSIEAQLSQHKDLLDRIRSMAKDDRLRPHVVALDKALKGEPLPDEPVAKPPGTETVTPDPNAELAKKLAAQEAKFTDKLETERAHRIMGEARESAVKYLDSLPTEYTDDHKRVIARLWNSEVDWDSIEADPSIMNRELARSLESVLTDYPMPSRSATPGESAPETKPVERDPGAELLRLIKPNWAAADDKGNLKVSDDQFNKVLAHSLRLSKEVAAKQRG